MSKATAEFPLLDYLDGLVDALRAEVPKALGQWEEKSIHAARVATRRLKAAVELLDPVLKGGHRKTFARTLKKLRRRLGPLRDLDVMIGHLQEIPADSFPLALPWVAGRLEEIRKQQRQEVDDGRAPSAILAKLGDWWGVREDALHGREAVDSLLTNSVHLQLDAFIEQADRLAAGDGPAASDATVQDPHQLRIAGKALRYTLEMANEHGRRIPVPITRAFKKMQDAMGLWHDMVVLTERLMSLSLEDSVSHHSPALQHQLLDLARLTLRKSEQQLAKFTKLWQRQGGQEGTIAQTLRERFPLTTSVSTESSVDESTLTESQMDHDRPSSDESPDPEDVSPASPPVV